MPIYQYECSECGAIKERLCSIAERHFQPPCVSCDTWMGLIVSPVRGIVKFPAAGGQEYVSPVSGKPITTERARRDDLARSGCRPYEGFEQERKHADKVKAAEEKAADAALHDSVAKAYHQLPAAKKAVLANDVTRQQEKDAVRPK